MNTEELGKMVKKLDEARLGMLNEFCRCARTSGDEEKIEKFMDFQERHQILLAKITTMSEFISK